MHYLLSFVSMLFLFIGLFTSQGVAQNRGKGGTDDETQCANAKGDPAIAACTRFIASGRARGRSLAVAYFNRSVEYVGKGDYDRAIADSSEAIRLNPSYADAYVNRGLAFFRKGDYDRAIADYNEAIRLDPKFALAYYNRGLAIHRKGDYDRAIADYNEAIRLNPKYVNAYYDRGLAHYFKDDYDRAVADYNEAIRLNPSYANAYVNRGLAFSRRGDYDRAIADYNEAIRLDPKYALAYNNRGAAFLAKDEFDRAIADYSEAIRLDPRYALAYNNRSFAFLVKGDYERAIADANVAIGVDPKFAKAFSYRGFAYGRKGDFARAMTDLNKGIELDPKSAEGFGSRGLVHEAMGELALALADLRMALSLGLPLALTTREATEGVRRIEQKLAAAGAAKVATAPALVVPTPQAAPPVVAPAAVDTGRRVALVIGNGAYRHSTVLPNPANDAADMAQALRELGFDVIEGSDLDWAGIHAKVREFGRKLDDATMAMFFYAGHGVQVDGRNYLVPVDGKLDRAGTLDQDAVDVQAILRPMEAEKRVNLVFLDACRDNPFTRSLARSLGASRSSAVGQGLAAIPKASGTLITYATEPGNTAADGEARNSPFTAALLKHIRKPGIEIEQMMKLVRLDVMATTREKQLPRTDSGLLTEVFLRRAP